MLLRGGNVPVKQMLSEVTKLFRLSVKDVTNIVLTKIPKNAVLCDFFPLWGNYWIWVEMQQFCEKSVWEKPRAGLRLFGRLVLHCLCQGITTQWLVSCLYNNVQTQLKLIEVQGFSQQTLFHFKGETQTWSFCNCPSFQGSTTFLWKSAAFCKGHVRTKYFRQFYITNLKNLILALVRNIKIETFCKMWRSRLIIEFPSHATLSLYLSNLRLSNIILIR